MPEDWLKQSYEEEKAGDAGVSVIAARKSKPDVAARANAIGRRLGIPADTVERNLTEIEERDRAVNTARTVQQAPLYTQQWYTNPRNAAAGGDDAEQMAALARQVSNFALGANEMVMKRYAGEVSRRGATTRAQANSSTWLEGLGKIPGRLFVTGGNLLGTMATSGWNTVEEFTETVLSPVDAALSAIAGASGADFLDPERLRSQQARTREANLSAWQRRTEESREQYRGDNAITEGLLAGLESVPLTIGALLTRDPRAAAGLIGGGVGAQSYQEGRQQGMGAAEATRYAITQGVPEAAFEIAPSAKLLELSGKGFVKNVIDYLQAEVPSEMATTLAQSFSDWVYRNPDQPYSEWAATLPEAEGQTVLGVLGGGAVTVGAQQGVEYAGAGIRRGAEFIREKRAADRMVGATAQARAGTALLDEIMGQAAATQMRETDPEAFQQYVEGLAQNTPIENVYIPAEAIRELMQDGYREHPAFAEVADQIDEALALEADVVIPLAQVATHLAGTPEWEVLRAEARFSPGGLSEAEMTVLNERFAEQRDQQQERLTAMSDEATAAAEPAAAVFADIKTQLEAAGYTPQAADRIASVYAAQRETWGARLGMTALEYHQQNPIRIQRAGEETPGGRVIEQDDRPLAYHGTGIPKTRFERRNENGGGSLGIHFSPDRTVAEDFAEMDTMEEGDTPTVLAARLGMQNPKRLPASFETQTVTAEMRDALEAEGFDGIIALDDNGEVLEYIAFDPDQIELVEEADGRRLEQGRDRGGRAGGRDVPPLDGAPRVEGGGPNPDVVAVAEDYAQAHGIALHRQAEYVELDVEFATRLAAAYEAMEHAPADPQVAAAYADLIRQTRDQYDALVEAGYSFSFFDEATDPYEGNAWNSMRDIRSNKHMAVYSTAAGYGSDATFDSADNPMLADTGLEWPDAAGGMRKVLANDLFRAVHDVFGHGIEGAGFRARGEENAWQAHSRLFYGPALAALTSETRGQNSWVNFGPHGEGNRDAVLADTTFADQKTGLLPEWAWTERRAEDQATVVADESGQPRITFHGTPFEFDRFMDRSRAAWFTESPSLASSYAGGRRVGKRTEGRVIQATLSAQNPLLIAEDDETMIADPVAWAQRYGLDIAKHGWERKGPLFAFQITRSDAFGEAAREAGYDVIGLKEGERQTWGVLKKNMVRERPSERMLYQDMPASFELPSYALSVEDWQQGELFPHDDLGEDPNVYVGDAETIEVDGVERPTTNAQGYLIADRVRHVENFWRWFGGSKMVDEEGRPQVFYHGTKADFASLRDVFFFDPDVTKTFFFSADKATAEGFHAGQPESLLPVYLKLDSIAQYDAEGRMWSEVEVDYDGMADALEEARQDYVRDRLDSFEPDSRVEQIGEEWVLYNNLDGEQQRFDNEAEAYAELEQIEKREREQYEEHLREEADDMYEDDLLGDDLSGWHTSTDDLAHAHMGRTDAVYIHNVDEGSGETDVVIVLGDSHAVKHTGNYGDYSPEDPRVLYQMPPFFSALERAVQGISTNRAPAAQWLATLKKAPGVKEEELEWTGLEEWLAMQQGPVEKEAVLGVIRDGGIKVEEAVLGNMSDEEKLAQFGLTLEDTDSEDYEAILADDSIGSKFSNWSSDPNNDTYRELLITLPLGEGGNPERAPRTHWDQDAVVAHTRFMDKTGPNGEKILFVEEVQSDWHQKGRDQGYEEAPSEEGVAQAQAAADAADAALNAADTAYTEAQQRMKDMLAPLAQRAYDETITPLRETLISEARERGAEQDDDEKTLTMLRAMETLRENEENLALNLGVGTLQTQPPGNLLSYNQIKTFYDRIVNTLRADFPPEVDQAMNELFELKGAYDQAYETARLRGRELNIATGGVTQGIPNAPFKSSWPALVMKRIIHWAATNGYDQVAWTTGEQQAERYNLSQAVGSLDVAVDDSPVGQSIEKQGGERSYKVVFGSERAAAIVAENVSGVSHDHRDTLRLTRGALIEAFGSDLGKRIADEADAGFLTRNVRKGETVAAFDEAEAARQRQQAAKDQLRTDAIKAMSDKAVRSLGLDRVQANQHALDNAKSMTEFDLADELPDGIERLKEIRRLENERADLAGRATLTRMKSDYDATFQDEDLRVGGEGMKAFYDRNLVNITNKIIKKYGAKVGSVQVPPPGHSEMGVYHRYQGGWWFSGAGGPDSREFETREEAQAALEADAESNAKFTQPGFTITPELREAAKQGFALFQGGARGRVSGGLISGTPGPAIIELFENSDLSTVIHETAHVWLEELKANAGRVGVPEDVRADWLEVQKWFADNGHVIGADGMIPTEAHELWARGFERYTMEGKAPSTALRKAFDAFRGWLLTIYKHVANLKSPITPEVRKVFDRMLATQEQIDEAADRQAVEARFQSAEQAGMTEAEFAAYRQVADEARTEAFDALLYRTMAAIRRERTVHWQQEEARVRDEVTQVVNQRPEFRALHFLRTGRFLDDPERDPVKMRLDQGWLEEHGVELAKLPKGVPPIYKQDGDDPEIIANMTGFRSAQDMLDGLTALEEAKVAMREEGDARSVRERLIGNEVQRIMAERHGDPLNDGSIEEEALAAIHNEREGELIASENRALARQSRQRPTPYSMARQWARQKIAEGKVVDVISRSAIQRYARAQAKAAKAFEAALAEGNVEEAFRQSEIRLLNHALIAEASKAAERVEVAVERLSRLARSKGRKSVDAEYYERAQMLLEKFEFRPRTQRKLDEIEAFAAWATKQEANGIDVITPPRLESDGEHYTRIAVEELLGLDDSVQQLLHLGRRKKKLLDAKEKREFDEVVHDAVATVEGIPQKASNGRLNPNQFDRLKNGLASFDAALLKMEQVFDWLDDGNPNGVFNRHVLRPIAEAQREERDRLGDMLGKVRELLLAVPKDQVKKWEDKVETPLLDRETGKPFDMVKQDLISMALNVGNEGNFEKLAGGYGWNRDTIMEVLDRELTKEEWQFVQGVWDLVNTLWPEIEALEKRVNGVAPPKIEPRSFTLADGTQMRGGYYPVVYDPLRNYQTEAIEGVETSKLFSNGYQRASTRAGHTKERTAVQRPIHLSLSVLNRHLTGVIHDLTHREPIMQADRFLADRRVVKAVDDALGREIRKQFRPWLSHIANEWAIDNRGLDGIEALAKRLRTSSTIIGMGFRLTTILAQAAGYAGVAEKIGTRWLASGVKTVGRDPVGSFNFVMERSNEVRHRMDTLERDIDTNVKEMAGKRGPLANVRRFAFHGIGYMDRVVVIPAWIGAYNKGMSEGMTEDEAANYGDKVVRESQGSGAAKDLSALQRGGEYMRLATMFYSYASAFYNRQRNLGRDVKRALSDKDYDKLPGLLARAWWLLVVSPILGQLPGAILSGGGPDEDKDETWAGWMVASIAANMFYGVPIARDIASSLATGFDYQFTPAARAIETLVRAGWDIKALADLDDETETSDRAVKTGVEAVGYTLKLPIGQVANAAQFITDWANGENDPDGVGEWLEGLQRGKLEK